MYYIGLDVHKKTISYCVKDASGRICQEGKVGATRWELDIWIKTLPQPWTAAMEATIFTGWIYDHLKPHAAAVKVAHPLMLRAIFTSPLPTGVLLDPAGDAVDLGSLPINLVLTPEKDRAVIVLSGWREQGVQVVDLKTRKVTQTLLQDGAFYGAAFSPDGHHLYVSGGNTDMLFVYTWKNGSATLENKLELAKTKTEDGTGTSYPAGVAVAPNGKFVYVAENVSDRLAVVNGTTGEIVQRFPTDHYPYDVALTADGQVFVSAWGGSTVSQFRVLADGPLAYVGRIEVDRHPSALAVRGPALFVTLAGSDRVAVVDTKLRKVARYLHDAAPGAPPEGSTPNAIALPSLHRTTRPCMRCNRPNDDEPSRLTNTPGAMFPKFMPNECFHITPGPEPGYRATSGLPVIRGRLRVFDLQWREHV